MVIELYKRPYRVRRAARSGKEITIAPEAKLSPGDLVIQFFGGFVLIVPLGTRVDEALLQQAVELRSPEAP